MATEGNEQSLQLEDENYYYRRISNESFFLRKDFGMLPKSASVDLTGSRALMGTGRVTGGRLLFRTNHGDVAPPTEKFGIFIPPFSIYSSVSDFERTELALLMTSNPELMVMSDVPKLFKTSLENFRGTAEQCDQLIEEMLSENTRVFLNESSSMAKSIKSVIDSEYSEIGNITNLAQRFELENWELSRIFKQSYGISPLKYLNKLRTIEAVYRLIRDGRKSKVIDVAFNVGFRDLSRFNKQFKSCVRFIPKNLWVKKD
ncbi:MAG TPA: hypothetical protein DCO79_15975 [Spirochaeta sp.]|nr:hypothetical protein [Spirochaeta sp.]